MLEYARKLFTWPEFNLKLLAPSKQGGGDGDDCKYEYHAREIPTKSEVVGA